MKLWTDFARVLTLQLPDCPEFTIGNAVQRAAIEFYTNTRAWRLGGVTLATTVASQRAYTVASNPANADLIGLPAIWIDGEEADELPDGAGDDYEATDTSSINMVGVTGATSITLAPAPITAGLIVTATAAYAPSTAATGISDELYRLHRQAIEAKALAALLMMRGKPWFDPAGSQMARADYDSEALFVSSQAGPMRRRGNLRTRAV